MSNADRPERQILDSIEEVVNRLGGLLPPGATQLKTDCENNARAMLKAKLEKMDLVSREEFDIQQRVLAKTRERLKALEARLVHLEDQQAGSGATPTQTSPNRNTDPDWGG